jgi:Zn2+/Cd2+-exporting ATPase
MHVQKSVYLVDGMCCADEQRVIEKRLRTVEGIEAFSFNLVANKLYVTHSLSESDIPPILKSAGFSASLLASTGRTARRSAPAYLRTHIPTLAALVLTALAIMLESLGVSAVIVRIVLGVAIVWGGWKTGRKALAGLRSFTFDMNVLMSAAVLGALALGKWSEAAAVIALFALSQLLEELSLARTRRAISTLLESAPRTASVLRDGNEFTVALDDVRVNDTVKIRPGEKIPADGIVTLGHSSVNQSAITGESLPSEKIAGSRVYAGTLNERGTLEITVERTGSDTTMAHIIHLVEQAQSERAPAQRFIDRFAAVYSPSVMALAVLIAVLPPIVVHAEFGLWFYRALVLLVIACPCALVISTPVTIISGLTAAARNGILIKGGRVLEESASIRALAFDKTGTLTYGTPAVTDIFPLDGLDAERLLRLAALGEQHSEHVLAEAILRKAAEMHVAIDGGLGTFEAFPGKGISIVIDRERYFVGNRAFLQEQGIDVSGAGERLDRFEREGKTVIAVGSAKTLLGAIAVADIIRRESREACTLLQRHGIEHTVLLSGDNEIVVRGVADALGIDEAQGGLLPEQKVEAVRLLRKRFGNVAMVGDGINDAPALASSTVGIAIGDGGIDAVMETADVILMKNDLRALTTLFWISKRTMRVLKQNIAIALCAKAVFLLLGVAGLATLWMAVIADDGVTLLVVFNALRLLKQSSPAAA